MDSAHDRFETLAVGHALGGLDASDSAEFRRHLQRCAACRRRIAELRGIADDLAAAERDERVRSRVRTEVPPQLAAPEPPALPTISVRAFGVLVLVTCLVLGALGFWNLHLRTQVGAAVATGERLETTLRTLAEGQVLQPTFAGAVRGLVARDDRQVAFALTGLPELAPDEAVVVWLLDTSEGDVAATAVRPQDGALTGAVELDDAQAVLLTRQPLERGQEAPAGTELVRAPLGPAG